MSSSTVMKQGIREKCIDWAKSVVDSAISTPPLLSGEHISEHTYMSGPLYGIPANSHACGLKTSISRSLTPADQFLTPD